MKWILVVEPSDLEQQYIERVISRMGHRFYTAEDGEHAIRYLQSAIPSLLLCSETLPDMTLPGFVAEVRKDHRLAALPMMLLSSNPEARARITATQHGFLEAVTRPISVRTFYHQVEGCLSSHRRKHLRAPMEFPVSVTCDNLQRDLETATFGEGGMYIKTEDPIPNQKSVRLSFMLPRTRRSFNLGARVLYALRRSAEGLPSGVGVQFQNLPEALRLVFGVFLENHLARAVPMV